MKHLKEKGYTVEDIEGWKNEHSRLNKDINESSY
ncbi:MAG: hypothetical protein JWQ09_5257 [Segetibacter sp.]|nr:hypothetical protein [Segetibacter sp.]